MTEETQEAIDTMVHRLVEQFNPEQIILFGSHARGTAGPDSDVDLLVVMPVAGSKRAQQVAMRVALHDIHVPKDIIVVTPDEVSRRRDIVGTLIRPALREGKVLYARCDFEEAQEAVSIAQRVRQQIRQFLSEGNSHPILTLGTDPADIDIDNASENHDKYIYTHED